MKTALLLAYLAMAASSFAAEDEVPALVALLNGTRVVAQDANRTFLGNISGPRDSDSIFNEQGTYGNERSAESIWNPHGTFRNERNAFSPFNGRSTAPPMILKGGTVVGHLTTNPDIDGGVSPHRLKSLQDRF